MTFRPSILLNCLLAQGCEPAEPVKPDSISYLPTGYAENDTGDCLPVVAQVECRDGALITPYPLGYINQAGVFTMALQTFPVSAPANICERADVLPLTVVGPAAAQDYTALLTAALAANPAAYPSYGPVLATDTVLAVNGNEPSGGAILFNGTEVSGFSDPDGVNMANTVEVPDGCTLIITFCVQQCRDKTGAIS